MVQEANVTLEALHDVTQEERQLREYTSVTRAALDTDRLDFTFFGFYLI